MLESAVPHLASPLEGRDTYETRTHREPYRLTRWSTRKVIKNSTATREGFEIRCTGREGIIWEKKISGRLSDST